MSIKRIVLTGPTSSIGLAIINECIKQNIEVLALVNPDSKRRNRIPKSDIVELKECRIDEYDSLDISSIDKCDAFMHLAWAATGGDVQRNLLDKQVENIKNSLKAVDLAEKLGCEVFIGAGSQAEYGRKNEVLREDTKAEPETAYGMAKLCAGQMTRLACNQKGIRHIWTRILSTYGPGSDINTVICYTIRELLEGKSPSLTKGEQIWDFIYVEDAARALLLLAEKGRNNETYLIGSGNSDYLYNYLNKVRDAVSKETGKIVPELGLGRKDYSQNAVMHLACNIEKLKEETGFELQIGFEEGIQRTINWISRL